MEKVFVAQRVATKLFATEAAVDAAMIEVTEMMAELIQARKDLNLSPVVGNAASAKFAEAVQALATARSAIVDAHAELDEMRLRIGVRTRMVGVIDKPIGMDTAPSTGLRVAG